MEGYSKIASLMGDYPDALIFRRFSALSAQNLLYLQAELVHLEHELRECTVMNEPSGDAAGRAIFSKDWFTLASHSAGNEPQWRTMLQIRAKLKEYGDWLNWFTKKIPTEH
ncbi:hypothetical protein N7G274_010004 [Stereocaulon virgatum]|uniref:DUF6594 domain-containing protein n=1 Tax=Stereocaulon virgatum TaxID=373712 RepID=A0ABR3ZVY2_9LECA